MDVDKTIERNTQTAVRGRARVRSLPYAKARSLSYAKACSPPYAKDRKSSEAVRNICNMKCDKIPIHQTFLSTLTLSRMLGWTRLGLTILTAAAVQASSDQQLFQQHAAPGLKPVQRASDKANSTGNLIFWSVSSFLQHWPNSYHVNGMAMFRWICPSVLTRYRAYHNCCDCPARDNPLPRQARQRPAHKVGLVSNRPRTFLCLLSGGVLSLHLRDHSTASSCLF